MQIKLLPLRQTKLSEDVQFLEMTAKEHTKHLLEIMMVKEEDIPTFLVEEKFIGLYEMTSTTGKSLCAMIKDVLLRYGLPLNNLRSQTHDGTSCMSGKYKGCQAEVNYVCNGR